MSYLLSYSSLARTKGKAGGGFLSPGHTGPSRAALTSRHDGNSLPGAIEGPSGSTHGPVRGLHKGSGGNSLI